MKLIFLDTDDPTSELNGVVIGDNSQLSQILTGSRRGEPFVCKLTGENGFEIDIGIGEEGFVQLCRSDGKPPYLVAIAPGKEYADGETEFFSGGTPTPIPNRNCLPFDSVYEIAQHFMEEGGAHPAFAWEEV